MIVPHLRGRAFHVPLEVILPALEACQVEVIDFDLLRARCPAEELHTRDTGPGDCVIFPNRTIPRIYCQHTSCVTRVAAANDRLRAYYQNAGRSASTHCPIADALTLERQVKQQWRKALEQKAVDLCSRILEEYHWPASSIVAESPVELSLPVVLLEPDVVGGDIVPFVAPLDGQAVPAPTVALFESEAPQPSNVLIESNPPALQTVADEDELVFTPQTSAVCGAEPKLKFRLSGRDFNYSNFEAALLAAVFHGKPPGVLREILTKITTEDFTIVENRIIIEAMLNIHVNGGEVTTSSVLAHLKSTLEGFGPLWIDYVNRCASVAYNPMRISDYIGKLQEASAIRRGDTYTRYSYSEAFCAGLLKFHLPPMKCVGDSWYVYNGGIWELTGRDIFSLEAMESIHPDHLRGRAGTTGTVLSHAAVQAVQPHRDLGTTPARGGAAAYGRLLRGPI